MPGRLPLQGIRVLDVTHALSGPYASMILGDLGAEVIKIERPGTGDVLRSMVEPVGDTGMSDYFVAMNRNKKSVALDLESPAGAQVLRDLAAKSDVLIQNLRPGAMDEFGLGYESLRVVNPRLIYCTIAGYGSGTPLAAEPASDRDIQAATGLMATTGETGGVPIPIGTPIVDLSSGLYAFSAVMAALYARECGDGGQYVEVPLYEVGYSMMVNLMPAVATLGRTIPRGGRAHPQIVPYETFLCGDGTYAMIGALGEDIWQSLCKAIGKSEWIVDPRFVTNKERLTNRRILIPLLAEVVSTKSYDEWRAVLGESGVSISSVLEAHQAIGTEQATASGVAVPIALADGATVHTVKDPIHSTVWPELGYAAPPELGADGPAVLADVLGMDAAGIDRLMADGVLAVGEFESALATASSAAPEVAR